MTIVFTVAGLVCCALVALWWLADHERGMRWTKKAVRRSFPDVPVISPEKLHAWMEDSNRSRPTLLDVRETDEFAVSHLDGARRISPDATAEDVSRSLRREEPVVVYCAGGYRAAKVGRRLIEAGFASVRNLDGGIFAWANAGHPVVQDGRIVTEVHPVSRFFRRLLRKKFRVGRRQNQGDEN